MLMDNGMPGDICWIIKAKVRLAGESSNLFTLYMPRTRIVFINQEDKINFIKDGLSKESLDDILLTLETHHCGVVHRELLDLWHLFKDEQQRCSLGNLTLKDLVCQFIRKLDGKHIPDS
ncbi:hypothetical protein FNV43_RR24665 [Rhamnella rubrinervis]|uniref:Uncharacterized protein n=1 Tax=Rhamnella rubrinervis TaxID=2594499 RepID=A0A8K0DSU8_9ROSA|nr:hypothetical protein FNV43_RR24665 [Rhamnella rubrinervis]